MSLLGSLENTRSREHEGADGHTPEVQSGDDSHSITTVEDHSDERDVAVDLRKTEVIALIVNKMIGTGIFTAPAITYTLTGSKWLTLLIWGIGILYTLYRLAIERLL